MPDDAAPTAATAPPHPASRAEWLALLGRIGRDHGAFNRIGREHHALFVDEGDTLLVSFDEAGRVHRDALDGMPDGFALVRRREWSLLSILADGDTWFRDPAIAAFLTALVRSGVLSGYRRILLTGLGPMCGHAASTYARLLPGATVLISNPVASLSHRIAPFERRFGAARRGPVEHAFGRGPEGLQHSRRAVVLFDPMAPSDAAHAALYRAENIEWVGLPHSATVLEDALRSSRTFVDLMSQLAKGPLSPAALRDLVRPALRSHPDYLERLVDRALSRGQDRRAALIAAVGQQTTDDPRFERLAASFDGAIGA